MSNMAAFGTKKITSGSNPFNALDLLVRSLINGSINTCEVVKVMKVYPGGPDDCAAYVDVLPLVSQTDAKGESLGAATLFRLPYLRLQGGVAALIIDPVVGDTGLAVYAKKDSSNIGQGSYQERALPASFRTFDQADGFYVGGFLNQKPEIYLELNQDKKAVLHAPIEVTINTQECVVLAQNSCTVNTKTCTIEASLKTTISSPETHCTGNMMVGGNLSWGGFGAGPNGGPALFKNGIVNQSGGITNQGGINNQGGRLSSNGISLENHTHSGIYPGNSQSGTPKG
ncbi:MAG: hypothetical protein ACRCTY_02805 [Candidatus Adiutrix sp.]